MILANLLLLQCFAICLWLYSVRVRNVNVVDVFWGLGYAIVAVVTAGAVSSQMSHNPYDEDVSHRLTSAQWLLLIMVVLWGVRLGIYLAIRSWGKQEDHRYAAMRNYWGDRFQLRSLFTVFGLQALLIWFISLPIQLGLLGQASSTWAMTLGFVSWLIGFVFETVGDWQMFLFKRDPKNRGRVMNRGLWKFTRHPNYFGDFMVWWGIYLVAAQPGSWWWTIIAPVLMSFLLLRVSGVTLLESSLKTRIEGYEQYVSQTSSFIPWPPKSPKAMDREAAD